MKKESHITEWKQIWNDAVLPENWTVDILKKAHPSKPYNPDIANTMFRAGMVEAWGRGTIDILNYCSDYGLVEPEFRFDVTGFSVIFRGKTSVKTPVKTPVKILDRIRQSPEITLVQIAKAIDMSPSAVERAAAKLV
jgi:ATP-dependent DNA helicase RecG